MCLKTPIAFIVFNRPDTTTKVFETIRAAKPAKLLVIADGARSEKADEADKCRAVRAIIDTIDWPCKVLTNYSETNLGCKLRVSSGLDWLFEQVEEAIILEDDCLPHPSFFRFCEEMLCRYRDDERVMMVGGTNYLQNRPDIKESYFFSRYFAIWGWGTWRRAWRKYDISLKDWIRIKGEKHLAHLYPQKFMQKHLTALFDAAYTGNINTWDIQWFYACLFNNGLTITPKLNLISNIGLIGTHSENTFVYNNLPTFNLYAEEFVHPNLMFPENRYDSDFINHYSKVVLSMKFRYLVRTFSKIPGLNLC